MQKERNEYLDCIKGILILAVVLGHIASGRNPDLVKAWFLVNLHRVMGDELNLYRDVDGNKLSSELAYDWHSVERAFEPSAHGEFSADSIKLLRLMSGNDLELLLRIKYEPQVMEPILKLIREL